MTILRSPCGAIIVHLHLGHDVAYGCGVCISEVIKDHPFVYCEAEGFLENCIFYQLSPGQRYFWTIVFLDDCILGNGFF